MAKEMINPSRDNDKGIWTWDWVIYDLNLVI